MTAKEIEVKDKVAEQTRQGLEGRLVKNCIRAIFNHEFSAKTHMLIS